MEEEETRQQEIKSMEKKVSPGLSVYMNYILLILCGIFFLISYFLKFVDTTEGTISLVTSIAMFVLFLISSMKPSLRFNDEDYIKPPEYYYTYLKEHYHGLFYPRLNIDFVWTGHHMFYPSKLSEFIFMELFDRNANKPLIAIIRVSRDKPSLRGLYKGSWDDFLRYKIYRLKMSGFVPSSGSQITVIGADGKPVTMPTEALDIIGKF